jgi:hypothetical protein
MHQKMNTIQLNLLGKDHPQILKKIPITQQALTFIPSSPHPFIPFLILKATHARAVRLIGEAAVHKGTVVAQAAVPTEARTDLCTTPPETVVANVVVCPIVVAVTARETLKSTLVGSTSIG